MASISDSNALPSRGWDETPIDWHEAAAGPIGIYSDVQLWTDGSADAGSSRDFNIDLAPKVQRWLDRRRNMADDMWLQCHLGSCACHPNKDGRI